MADTDRRVSYLEHSLSEAGSKGPPALLCTSERCEGAGEALRDEVVEALVMAMERLEATARADLGEGKFIPGSFTVRLTVDFRVSRP